MKYNTATLQGMVYVWGKGSPHTYRQQDGRMQVKYSYRTAWEECDDSTHEMALYWLRRKEWLDGTLLFILQHPHVHATVQDWLRRSGTLAAHEVLAQKVTGEDYVNLTVKDIINILADHGVPKGWRIKGDNED